MQQSLFPEENSFTVQLN